MTQEEKEILLKYLCMALPYGFIVHRYSDNVDIKINTVDGFSHFLEYSNDEKFKPYLRPMSSMTEEERNNLRAYCRTQEGIIYDIGVAGAINCPAIIDFLNKNHFDYRGLIPKGLAIEITEDNNPYKYGLNSTKS